MDFFIKNGTVYDPQNHEMRIGDIALHNGIIAQPDHSKQYRQVINAEGCVVTTGLIDYHVHYYFHGNENSVSPDATSFCCGVTTAVDAGSCGAGGYELFRRSLVAMSEVRLLSFLHVSSGGQSNDQYPENIDPSYFDEEKILSLFRKYPKELIGLKTRLSFGITTRDDAVKSLKRTIQIAEKAGVRVIVHVTNCVMHLDELAELLRPGDVMCHIYHGRGNTCIGSDGRVLDGLVKAHERGIFIDASNGRSNYSLDVCQKALSQGFFPDVISSDINTVSNFLQPLHSLPRIMSKYLALGLGLEDIIDAATITPARLINQPELGSMAEGTVADICILKIKNKTIDFEDVHGLKLTGSQAIVPMMTFKNGKCVYCQADFS